MARRYRFLAADLLTNTIRDEVPIDAITFGHVLDSAGAFGASLALTRRRTITALRPYSQSQLLRGPAGYWRLDELANTTAADCAGGTHDGTYSGTFTLGADGLIVEDRDAGLAVAGAGYVEIPDSAAFSPITTGQLGIYALVSLATLPTAGNFRTIAAKWNTGQIEWALAIDSAGRVNLKLQSLAGTSRLDITSAAGLTLNTPVHIVASIVDGGACAVYVNGALVASGTASGATANGTSTVRIGARSTGAHFWNGTLDEVAITPTAPTAADATALALAAQGQLESVAVSFDPVTRSVIDPGRTILYVEKDAAIVGAYIVWNARPSLSRNELSISGEGLWSYWTRKRAIRQTIANPLTFDQVVYAYLIVLVSMQVWGTAAEMTISLPAASGHSRDVVFDASERSMVGAAVEQLAALQHGFDFEVVTTGPVEAVTNQIRFYYPRKGITTGGLLIDLGVLDELDGDVDGTQIANRVEAIGSGAGRGTQIATAIDAGSLEVNPYLDVVASYPEIGKQQALQARAAADLAALLQGTDLPTVTFQPLQRPEFQLGAWSVGDNCMLRAASGWMSYDRNMRIVADEITVDANDAESVTLTLCPPELMGV